MAGYSGTPLPKKLGIKDGHRVALINAPKDFNKTLGDLPTEVALQSGLGGKAPLDIILLFVIWRAELERQLAGVRRGWHPTRRFGWAGQRRRQEFQAT
jgi:hypothetical protein